MNRRSILFFILGSILGIITFFFAISFLSKPQYNSIVLSSFERPYLQSDVRIYRGEYGIPHIKSKTLKEGYYGLGYAHAIDRLWQMHIRRMSSQGRLAEILGDKALDFDKFIRNLGYLPSSHRIVQNLDQNTKEYMQAYADGINDGVKSLQMLPIEFYFLSCSFPEWTIFDSVTFTKFLSFVNINDFFQEFIRSKLDEVYGREIAEILGAVGPNNQHDFRMTVVNDEELQQQSSLFEANSKEKVLKKELKNRTFQFSVNLDLMNRTNNYYSQMILPTISGSNGWVIHGQYTQSGKPHLANDPHLENVMPSQWYQSEIIYEDEDNNENFLIGASLPGIPLTLSGRTKYLAWGITILYSDGSDIYQETMQEINGKLSYLFKDEWLPVRETVESINIRYQDDPLNITIYHTHHGPILDYFLERYSKQLANHEGKFYSLQSIVHIDDIEGYGAMIQFYKEKDLQKALNQLSKPSYPNLGMPVINETSIGYVAVGRLVIKDGNPNEGAFVKMGWTGENEWLGYIPLQDQPKFIDPPKGYFCMGNNKFLPDSDKYHLSWNTNPSARARRINDLIIEQISNGKKFTIEDQKRIQNDIVDVYAKNAVPWIVEIVEFLEKKQIYNEYFDFESNIIGKTNRELIQQACQLLKKWDFEMQIESVGASIYQVFEFYYLRKFGDELSKDQKSLEWTTHYIFDSFNYKNIEQLYQAISKDLNSEILNAKWCSREQPQKYQCIFNILNSLKESIEYLSEKFGSDSNNWQWSNLHYQYFPHIPLTKTPLKFFFDRRIPYKGNRRTIHVSSPDLRKSQTFDGETGSNFKMVVSMDLKEKSQYVIDTGISGNVMSPHYDDQMKLWSKGQYIEMTWGSKQIPNYKYMTILKSKSYSKNSEQQEDI